MGWFTRTVNDLEDDLARNATHAVRATEQYDVRMSRKIVTLDIIGGRV